MIPAPRLPPSTNVDNSCVFTVADAIAAYLIHAIRHTNPRNNAERVRLLNLFAKTFGARAVESCRSFELQTWIDGHAAWQSGWTKRRVASTILGCMNWCSRMDLIPKNPFSGVHFEVGEFGRDMQPEEFLAALRVSRPEFRRLMFFMRWTAARPGEVSALKWSFIDWNACKATLVRHKTAKTRKDRRPRVIILPAPAMRLLKWLRRQVGESQPFIFLNRLKEPWSRNAIGLRWFTIRHKAKLPKSCKLYGIRHRTLSDAIIKGGLDLATVSELAGHTSTSSVTQRYIHLANELPYLHEALAKTLGLDPAKIPIQSEAGAAKNGKPEPPQPPRPMSYMQQSAFDAYCWAVKQAEGAALSTDREIWDFLLAQTELPYMLPPTFETWARHVRACRLYYDKRKRVLGSPGA
jgi:integrase